MMGHLEQYKLWNQINSNGQIFHIGNDDEVTIRDFVQEAGKIMN